jgi:agmatinase
VTQDLQYETFLGLEPEACSYEESRVVLIRVPYDGTASYGPGARNGPRAIMEASAQVELWDLELQREPWREGIYTLPLLEPSAVGPEDMVARVQQYCLGPLRDGKIIFLLGGEHSISVGGARAVHQVHGSVSFLHIDAHPDLRDSYEGLKFSHATVARRNLELGPVVHVGIRTACEEELEVIRAQELRPVWAHQIHELEQSEWIERVLAQLGSRIYVSVDLDGLDPSVIPATGTPVPGGLSWYHLLALLRAVGDTRQIVGCDLCELAPIQGQQASDFAAPLLAYKLIGYFVR